MHSNTRRSLNPAKRLQTPKAIREANRRKKESEDKRFNEPLRIFLERKHPEILTEFGELYKYLDFVNPGKKNLCKSSAFKEWMTENPLPVSVEQNIPVIPLPPPNSAIEPSSETVNTQGISLQFDESAFDLKRNSLCRTQNVKPRVDIIGDIFKEVFGDVEPSSEAVNSTQNVEPSSEAVNSTQNVEPRADIVGDILKELFDDAEPLSETVNSTRDAETEMNEHYNMLMAAADVPIHNIDEGIELNHYDELAYDFEPFDFNMIAYDDFNMI